MYSLLARRCGNSSLERSPSSAPAGMITSRPLRVAWGSGEPQNDVAKLRAVGSSVRHKARRADEATFSSDLLSCGYQRPRTSPDTGTQYFFSHSVMDIGSGPMMSMLSTALIA